MAGLIVLPLLLAWALLPGQRQAGRRTSVGPGPAAAAAPAPELAKGGDAPRTGSARRPVPPTTTTRAATTTTKPASTTTKPAPKPTAAPTSRPAAAGNQSTAQRLASDLFERLNAERRARGLAALDWDGGLARIAGAWSAEMASSGNFRHRDLGAASGLPGMSKFSALGENIAWVEGYPNMGNQLHVGWMRSDGPTGPTCSSAASTRSGSGSSARAAGPGRPRTSAAWTAPAPPR